MSTDKQTVENQRFEIKKFCLHENLDIDSWIEETISGTLEPSRRQLGKLLKNIRKNDLIICSELSRLGRSLFMIMSILNLLMVKGAKVWTVKDNYRLGDDIQSKVLAFAFGISAEIERNLISQRTKEALCRKRAEGIRLGRPKGAKSRSHYLDGTISHIMLILACDMSRNAVAAHLGISRTTLNRALMSDLNQKREIFTYKDKGDTYE